MLSDIRFFLVVLLANEGERELHCDTIRRFRICVSTGFGLL